MPVENKKSSVEEAQGNEQSGWKTKAAMGFQVLMLAAAIYGFYKGVLNLIALKQQYDKYVEYFQ